MRLLHIDYLTFEEFSGDDIPPYIITSHRWSKDEITYKEMLKGKKKGSEGYKKIAGFCEFARQDRDGWRKGWRGPKTPPCNWIWIDTCCIDKTSSAELSEAINSMCSWYRDAEYCCAYLADISLSPDAGRYERDFGNSDWFRRGWTLQELLAPSCVIFVDATWKRIGCKMARHLTGQQSDFTLNARIAEITGIPMDVVQDFSRCHEKSPEDRMKWIAGRRTTRPEDIAYCLLGIFDVYLPLIYGEGAENALERLKEEIRKKSSRTTPASTANTRAERVLPPRNISEDGLANEHYQHYVPRLTAEPPPVWQGSQEVPLITYRDAHEKQMANVWRWTEDARSFQDRLQLDDFTKELERSRHTKELEESRQKFEEERMIEEEDMQQLRLGRPQFKHRFQQDRATSVPDTDRTLQNINAPQMKGERTASPLPKRDSVTAPPGKEPQVSLAEEAVQPNIVLREGLVWLGERGLFRLYRGHKRLLVLQSDKLVLFETETNGNTMKTISLKEIADMRPSAKIANTMEIQEIGSNKVYALRFDTENELYEWMSAILEARPSSV